MKKIICLLAIALSLAACTSNDGPTSITDPNNSGGSSTDQPIIPGKKPKNPIPPSQWLGDWNDKKDAAYKPEYRGIYNPIVDKWIVTEQNGKPVDYYLAFEFDGAYAIEYADVRPEPKRDPQFEKAGRYSINSTQFRTAEGVIYQYKVDADRKTLQLFDGTNTFLLSYYDNNGVWEDKGDWNYKQDPHYFFYHGKYNPIEGTWKQIAMDGTLIGGEVLEYYDDLTVQTGSDKTSRRRYSINDIGVMEESYHNITLSYYSYRISNDTLYTQGMPGGIHVTYIRTHEFD